MCARDSHFGFVVDSRYPIIFLGKGDGTMDRIMGVLTLKAPVYKQIAEDENATTTATIIVVVMAIFAGVFSAVILGLFGSSLPPEQAAQMGTPLGTAIRTIINAIIGWLIGSWVIAFVAKTFFGGKTNFGEMLRVFGYTQIFQVFAIVPCLGSLVALILSLIGAVIGIREASEFSTGKAVMTGIVAFVILLIVGMFVGAVLGLVGLA
jgi:hypothetical protein